MQNEIINLLNFTVLFMRDYTAKFVDIGLDVEKHTLAGTALSAERIHLISETENLLSDKLYHVFIHSSLCYFGSFYDWHQRKKFPFRLPNLNIILKYTHEPKQLYKQFLFCCKTVRVFLIDQIFFRKTSKVVKLYKIRRLKVYLYINDPRVYLLFDIQNFILLMFRVSIRSSGCDWC